MKKFRWLSLLICFVMVFSLIPCGAFADTPEGGVEINETNFPDDVFRNYVSENCDSDGDGFLSNLEIITLSDLDVSSLGIRSLKGVEYFTAINRLFCQDNELQSLDVSSLTELEMLWCRENQLTSLNVSANDTLISLDCSNNQLAELDVSASTLLEDLACEYNKLGSLDISANPNLYYLTCYGNPLARLDISACPRLIEAYNEGSMSDNIDCFIYDLSDADGNTIASMWVDKSTEIISPKRISIDERNFPDAIFRRYVSDTFDSNGDGVLNDGEIDAVIGLDVSGLSITSLKGIEFFTSLQGLWCENNRLSDLSISHNTNLNSLWCYGNDISQLNISACPLLLATYIHGAMTERADGNVEYYCYEYERNELLIDKNTVIPVPSGVLIDEVNFPDDIFRSHVGSYFDKDSNRFLSEAEIARVTSIYLEANNITTLKGIEFFTELEELECGHNQLTELDVSHNTALKYLSCASNQLTELDVSHNTALNYLACAFNQITELDLSELVDLEHLECQINQLDELDLSNNPKLTVFSCQSNNLTELDLSNNTSLEWLWGDNNQLGGLDVSMCPELVFLGCNGNRLTSLDLSHNHELIELGCVDNLLTELDVSGCSKLEHLSCWFNNLTSLDVSACADLTVLETLHNPMTELDLSNNYALEDLACYECALTSLNLSHNSALKKLNCSQNHLTELDVSHNPELAWLWCHGNSISQLDISFCPYLVDVYVNGRMDEGSYTSDEYGYIEFYQYVISVDHQMVVDQSTEILCLDPVERIAGADRFQTAIEAADKLKAEWETDSFPNIVIASGTDFPDALAGAYLAIEKGAPVLLTNAGFAPTVADYVKANLQDGGTVYILGGTGAVPEVMETELQKLGISNVKRLAGSDRYQTNIEILKEAGVEGEDLLICSGKGYADSLSASALGKPILLVGNSLTVDQKEYLGEVKNDLSGNFYTLGGEGAVSKEASDQVNAYATGETDRIAGSDRFKTSVAIAQRFLPEDLRYAVLAYAMNYPDGLAGGPIAYAKGGPLILVTEKEYTDAKFYLNAAGAKRIFVMGGSALIPDEVAYTMLM